uniref:DDE Tnp4 domain-containing protein n=1 Tax=Paramormyrops kingsleyae TaxID=1676925 RepID=A0A3B3SAW4_9TELE
MSCPFMREQTVTEGARIMHRVFQIPRVLHDRQDPLAQHDNILLERYRFSREGIIYIISLLNPHVKCSTHRSRALTTAQTVCIALRSFLPLQYEMCPQASLMPHQGVHSVNVQMVCDSLSGPNIIDFSHKTGNYDGVLIGDRGYACREYFMTPFPDPGPQARYNAALTRTRARIEVTFGQLKGFQCLRVAPDRACDITVACSVLHNIATIRKERTPVVEVHPDDDLQPVHLDQPCGKAAWDRIVEYHFT